MRKKRLLGFASLAAALLSASLAGAQIDGGNPNLSRNMQLAIHYYEHGDDIQAMDRFISILTAGDPAERNMANEYINLINHRMNTGETALPEPGSRRSAPAVAEPAAAPAAAPVPTRAPAKAARAPDVVVEASRSEVAIAVSPKPVAVAAPRAAAVAPRVEVSEAPLPPVDKNLMKREIKAKIRSGVETGIKELRGVDGVKVVMQENGDPQAVAIPAAILFSEGVAFQKDATPIIEALTKMIFSLGSAQVVILPEGTAVGDAKIIDMRRTMGISAQLFSAGISPARVKVNLLNSQIDIPRPLADFRGIVIMFVYNQPLNLVVDSSLGEEGGPPISLGIYPPSFLPGRDEGAIIEFSVQDPPAGLISWKFQLLQPTVGGERDLAPLQDVAGGIPVFHQIYWNGRQNYFGAPLAPGRYEAVLTATDAKNRQRALHRWIQLIDVPGALGGAAPATVGAAPPAEIGGGPAPAASLVKEGPTAVQVGAAPSARKKGRKKKAAAVAAPAEAPPPETAEDSGTQAPAQPKATKPASDSVELDFAANTYQLSAQAERKLAQVHETLVYYPMENLKIVGYAESAEPDAAGLAERRAKMVAGLLVNKYQVEPKKIQVTSEVSATTKHKVAIDFVKSE